MMTTPSLLRNLPLTALAFTLSASAGQWPTWRGDAAMSGVAQESLTFPLSLAWQFAAAKPVKATAVSDGERFFIGDAKGKFFALGASDGKPVWTCDTKDSIEGSALLVEDKVVFGTLEGVVYCLEAKTGKEAWKFKTEGEVRAAPNAFLRKDQPPLVLIGSYDNRLYAIDLLTGKKVWQVETSNYINGSASVVEGMTAFGGCDGFVYFINAADGKEAGKVEIRNPIANTVAAHGSTAVLAHYGFEVVALDAKKFTPKWVYSEREFEYFASPAITADDTVFAADRGKRVHRLNAADGTEKWAFRTKGRVDSSPVVTGDHVVFGSDDGNVYAVSANDGTQVWSYEIAQPVQSSACIAGGRLVISADDGIVYAFGPVKK